MEIIGIFILVLVVLLAMIGLGGGAFWILGFLLNVKVSFEGACLLFIALLLLRMANS
ncbi:hypothetical protein O0554_17190 [Brevibacillus laterosporus]|uniref:Uncharacterized protein n=1 Tax=Brevibacillus laterosporus TaxID=1465 RepID=A0AAP3GBT1_BRELA|nr:hypothetical protein [Brevibacillus laterosporus]